MKTVVLVHGAWHGPWCWANVTKSLEDAGHSVIEVTLPGHDRPGATDRIWNRVSDYVEALASAVRNVPEPVVVGHSMGGYVVQRYLEENQAAIGVLVASAPRRGTLLANFRALRVVPLSLIGSTLTANYRWVVRTPGHVRKLFFTKETPDEVVEWAWSRIQNESAFALNVMMIRPIRTKRVSTPMMVIGAENDGIFTVAEQNDLARAYGVEAEIVGGGHDIMLDESWPILAERLGAIAAS